MLIVSHLCSSLVLVILILTVVCDNLQVVVPVTVPVVDDELCTKKPVIFNFGDSNSDTGGYAAAHGSEIGYPYGRTFFHHPTGRFSDGRLIIDFFSEHLNASYLSHYLNSLEPTFRNGLNFAIAGAATYPLRSLFSLDIQILQFKLFRTRSMDIYSRGSRNMIGEEDVKHALYTIDMGQNDLSYVFRSNSYSEATIKIPSYISEIRKAMWDLYLLGGRKFWVHNTGPLGCLPGELGTRKNYSHTDDFDQHGCLKALNDGAKLYNSKLHSRCQELQTQMENTMIVYVDIYSIKYNLIANAKSYGFENPLMACCGKGGGPYNYSPGNDCLDGGCNVCDETLRYISWDGVHYTEAANAVVASKILSNQYSSPSLGLKFFCTDDLISSI